MDSDFFTATAGGGLPAWVLHEKAPEVLGAYLSIPATVLHLKELGANQISSSHMTKNRKHVGDQSLCALENPSKVFN